MSIFSEILSTNLLVSFGTPLSVLVLAYQLWQRKKQFTTEFEDNLTNQYREIIYKIPVESLLGRSDSEEYAGELKDYYRYIDLSNEQIFLRQEGRVSKSTWENWRAGIETTLSHSDFRAAWNEIRENAPESFNELREFEDPDTPDDPRYWEHPWRARLEEFWYRIWNF